MDIDPNFTLCEDCTEQTARGESVTEDCGACDEARFCGTAHEPGDDYRTTRMANDA